VFSDDVKTYTLVADVEEGTKAVAYFSAGQYLSVRLKIGDVELTRPYSISSSPKMALDGYYQLTIKRVEGGLASEYILDNWIEGTKVSVSAPQGVFTYERLRDAKTVVGIAGGSGITPFRSLAYAIADGDEDCSLTLLYGSRTANDILFLDEFKALEKRTEKFKLVNVLSADEGGDEQGFITAELIKKYAPNGDYSIFLCGPQAMYEFVDKEIEKLNLRKKFIRHELFGEYRNPEKESDYPQEAVGKKFKLKVNVCGNVTELECDANVTLLNAMEKAGVIAPANCRSGECGWCHSRLVSGNVYVPKRGDGRRLADLKYGYVHPCMTFPLSDVELDVPPFKA
ncbi:MAG: iron-sulfur cluster-binding domain-containing protein, partial [Clostridia bacterium]|nr:iron-sulfur cluster-binding domain-containing protein [Clostridia bacterium]